MKRKEEYSRGAVLKYRTSSPYKKILEETATVKGKDPHRAQSKSVCVEISFGP
jgi:hypothetical protein